MDEPGGITQNFLRHGVVELTFGEPDPDLLPVELVRRAAEAALARSGAALAYGQVEGPPGLRHALARRITARERVKATAADVLVTGGNSQALEQVMTVFTEPGDVVIVESPTYNLALGIFRDHPVDIAGVRLDAEGLDVAALGATLGELAAAGRRARLLYTIPTYHNPAGVCLSDARRTQLLALARRHDLIVVEDDVYRELFYEGAAPASLWALDREAPVIRLGSFSKTLAPGLRVGWANARPDLLERLAGMGMLESGGGGGVSYFAAHVVERVLATPGYDEHVEMLRRIYVRRRDALAAALVEHLPAGCGFALPAGGFFVWLELPEGADAAALLPVAEAHGVSFAPGARFCRSGGERLLRLAFSLYGEDTLREGARRLAAAIAAASDA
jgi:DNA-binding transcriptional MocR family regulator